MGQKSQRDPGETAAGGLEAKPLERSGQHGFILLRIWCEISTFYVDSDKGMAASKPARGLPSLTILITQLDMPPWLHQRSYTTLLTTQLNDINIHMYNGCNPTNEVGNT